MSSTQIVAVPVCFRNMRVPEGADHSESAAGRDWVFAVEMLFSARSVDKGTGFVSGGRLHLDTVGQLVIPPFQP